MKRALGFASRCMTELLRDPAEYIFCLGLPALMLLIMTAVNKSIPEQAQMTLFEPSSLIPGIAVFSFTFIMLFSSITVSHDRASAIMLRLSVSPMKTSELCLGYTLPCLTAAAAQWIIITASGCIITILTGYSVPSMESVIMFFLCSLPVAAVLIFAGILIGTIFSEKASPSASSVIITAAGILGGIWMDVESVGGIFLKISECLPFIYSVRLLRDAYTGSPGIAKNFFIVCIFSVIFCLLSCTALRYRTKHP